MNETRWTACADPQQMLAHLRKNRKASDRKLRLVAVGVCRSTWHLLGANPGRRAVEVAERFADGRVTDKVRDTWHWAAYEDADEKRWEGDSQAAALAHAVNCAVHHDAFFAARYVTGGWMAQGGEPARRASATHCAVLRDVFGPLLFRPPVVEAAWNAVAVLALAESVYRDRRFEDLPVLADALEEAGCTDTAILGHLRGPGPHVRGCWVLDLLTGRE